MVEVHIPVLSEDQDAAVQAAMRYPTSTPHLNQFGLEIRDKGQGAGRGVYTTRALDGELVVESSPVLLFPPGEYDQHGRHTQLDGYTFVWKRTAGQKAVMALALGLGSLFNHSSQPNVTYTLDHAAHCIHYRTIRPVGAGEELTISYGAGRMWWESPPSAEALELQRREQLTASDPQFELNRLASMGMSDSEDEHPSPRPANGVEHSAEAGPSKARPTPLNKGLYPSMYRITAAKDPRTLPLITRPAWIVDIDPRQASSAIKFLQRHRHELQNRDDGRYSTRHLRSFKTGQATKGGNATAKSTKFLICLQDACPDRDELIDMLSGVEAVECFGRYPEPYLVPVPRAPAPTRDRLAEWQRVWPCLISSAATNKASAANTTWNLDMGGGQHVAVVDRHADEVMWQDPARLEWAVNRFQRCIALARHSLAQSGDKSKAVSSAVHVTHPFEQARTFVNTRGATSMSSADWTWREREELGDWAELHGDNAPIVGRIGEETELDLSWLNLSENDWQTHSSTTASLYQSPVADVGTIEVDALDQRVQKRNPLKHAAIEAIARVSILRALDRSAASSASTATSAAKTTSNVGDYLLTGLVMFCLYEPCVYCTMALLHSRVKEVYFLLPSPGSGGCCGSKLADLHACDAGTDGGVYALQEQKGLNHAFTVWRWMRPILALDAHPTGEDVAALQREFKISPLDP